jgi:hypothetical protein
MENIKKFSFLILFVCSNLEMTKFSMAIKIGCSSLIAQTDLILAGAYFEITTRSGRD